MFKTTEIKEMLAMKSIEVDDAVVLGKDVAELPAFLTVTGTDEFGNAISETLENRLFAKIAPIEITAITVSGGVSKENPADIMAVTRGMCK